MRIPKLNKNKKYLLACSYGPDSMALFNLLIKDNIDFDVAIVNYHLREESNLEVAGLKRYCELNNKSLFIKDVEEKIEKNVENNCREIRYSFFLELFKTNHYDALLIAHHQDDHIETYILQIRRHILPKTYGLAPVSSYQKMRVIRPLLNYSKQELLEMCKKENTPYMIDKSNLSDDYERNRIRHEIIEKMTIDDRKKYLKEIDAKNKELRKIFRNIDKNRLNEISYLLSLDDITYLYAINMVVTNLKSNEFISKIQGEEIRNILKSKKPNVISEFKTGLFLVKSYDEVYFYLELPTFPSYKYTIKKPCKLDTPFFFLDFRKEDERRYIYFSNFPLTIRTIKENDVFMINGYEVKAKRAFIDWKMPLFVRKQWPVILNKENKIIYVPRYQKGYKRDKNSNFYVKLK